MLFRNISEIKANPKNPRVIKDEKFAKLVKSLTDFPEMLEKRPLVCFTEIDRMRKLDPSLIIKKNGHAI